MERWREVQPVKRYSARRWNGDGRRLETQERSCGEGAYPGARPTCGGSRPATPPARDSGPWDWGSVTSQAARSALDGPLWARVCSALGGGQESRVHSQGAGAVGGSAAAGAPVYCASGTRWALGNRNAPGSSLGDSSSVFGGTWLDFRGKSDKAKTRPLSATPDGKARENWTPEKSTWLHERAPGEGGRSAT